MIEFPKRLTIDAIEKFLNQLEQDDNEGALLLPIDTASYQFGGLASAIQAANTWARNSDSRQLIIRPSEKKIELSELVTKPHKFCAAMSAKHFSLSDGTTIDPKAEIYPKAKEQIQKQSKSIYGQQRGSLCWFAFVDHSSKGFDPNFYVADQLSKPTPRQPAQIQAVIKAMVDKTMSIMGNAKPIEGDALSSLGRIFEELFINTHEHGSRGSSRKNWLKPSTRIVYTQSINLIKAGAKRLTEKTPALSPYLDAVASKYSDDAWRKYVEISIIDSGLGYCGRWLADNPDHQNTIQTSIEEEYAIFKKCFTFRQTSTSKDNKGHGLPVVMERLTKLNGFMRIRSGKLALYRDFIASPYRNHDEDCVFSDWETQSEVDIKPSTMPSTSGVAITLLIPVEAKK